MTKTANVCVKYLIKKVERHDV